MIVSKYLSGRCYPPGLVVWRPIDWKSLQLAKVAVERTERRSVVWIKPFSNEQRLQEPIISRSNRGMVVILSESISELPPDCIGVRITQSFDRYAFGEVVCGPVSSYIIWRKTGIGCPLTSKRVNIVKEGTEHFKCTCL